MKCDVKIGSGDLLPKSKSPIFGLNFRIPARMAVGKIVRTLWAIVRVNEERIPDDLDTEFLHDYRIGLRKIRSVLSQVKEVYPEEDTREVRRVLSELAQATNRLRDLDVGLLAREEHMALLPPDLRPAVIPMFEGFQTERSRQIRKLRAHLRSPSHYKQREAVETFFDEQTSHPESSAAEAPIGPLVFRRILKRYRKIHHLAKAVGSETSGRTIHQLRIECKKLRYLMEVFAELIPAPAADKVGHQLRRLQNRLGEFNDSSVQRRSFLAYWQAQKGSAGDSREFSLSLGGLVGALYQRQHMQRTRIQSVLDRFCSHPTAKTFKRTFKPQWRASQRATIPFKT